MSSVSFMLDTQMLRYRVAELIAEKKFNEGKVTTISEIADATAVSRRILSALVNNRRDANPTAETLEKLCRYFNCAVGQLVEYIPDEAVQKK